MRSFVKALAIAAAGATAAAGLTNAQDQNSVTAELVTAEGESAGTVTFQEVEQGLLLTAELMNLPEGPHGFHIHETGACEPDFEAAGGHYAPQGNEHGYDSAAGHHAGDLPNIVVQADGTANAEFFASWLTLGAGTESGPFTLLDEDGSAVMVHENADDHVAMDSAGSRIACGVIAAAQE